MPYGVCLHCRLFTQRTKLMSSEVSSVAYYSSSLQSNLIDSMVKLVTQFS